MRKVFPIIVLFVFTLGLFGVAEAGQEGFATVNMRACIDVDGDNACAFNDDIFFDGVTICWRPAGGDEQCGFTEDGEWWLDSLPEGFYWARIEGVAGHQLVGAGCTVYPNIPYPHCRVNGNDTRVFIHKRVNAVNVSFLFTPE